jgi:hypothetical protein
LSLKEQNKQFEAEIYDIKERIQKILQKIE